MTTLIMLLSVSGEIFELKAELNNEKKEKRKEAVKKVIAAMTVGKDVRCFALIHHHYTIKDALSLPTLCKR